MKTPTKLARRANWFRSIGDDAKAEALELQLTRAHRCKRCGRPLTDASSIAATVGPDCQQKLNNPKERL